MYIKPYLKQVVHSCSVGPPTGSKALGMCLECLCKDPDEQVPPKYEFLMTPKE